MVPTHLESAPVNLHRYLRTEAGQRWASASVESRGGILKFAAEIGVDYRTLRKAIDAGRELEKESPEGAINGASSGSPSGDLHHDEPGRLARPSIDELSPDDKPKEA